MRWAAILGCVFALAACTGSHNQAAKPAASEPKDSNASIRLSGTAIIGYVKDQ
ncbi:hypothetical protein [uncultured Roseobacter sp.]|uniref:hypothetical protein n=1 Tax=uncultured Roseobacter sp. TaxID=114847 RepID=UPI002625AD8A|nr:hypothetical protein [uncultured Roseobacter sp.]